MFRLSHRYILIICLIFLDLLLIGNILSHKNTEVLGVKITKKVKPTPTLKIKKSPTTKPTSTSTPSPTKAKVLSITLTKSPSPTIPPQTAPATTDLLSQVNNFRAGKGLAPVTAKSEVCFFANLRAQEIATSFNHDGFTNRINSKTLPYPSYSSVAENIAMNSNPNDVVPSWINSPGHNANMSKDVPYGCVVGSGNYYVFEAWKP